MGRRPAVHEGDLTVDSATRPLSAATRGGVQRITVTISPQRAARAGLIVRRSADGSIGTRIVYDTAKRTLTLDRARSGEANFAGTFSREHIVDLPLERGQLRLEIVVDRGSVEVFANGGRVALTDLIFPPRDADRVAVFAEQGRATFAGLTVTQLQTGDDSRGACTAR